MKSLAAVLTAALVRREHANSQSSLARLGGREPVAFVQLSAEQVSQAQARSPDAPVTAELNGGPAQAYSTSCSCEEAAEDTQGCSPMKVHVKQDRESSVGLGLLDASRIFEAKMPPFEQVKEQSFYCLDDRVEQAGLSTPGGDLGEFVLALSTYQDLNEERQVTQHMVDVWLQKYVKSFPEGRRFVHCSDDRALRHLQDQLQDETLNLEAPTEHVKPELLDALGQVENLGDAHFRLMLKEPENYHVDARLVVMAIRSFYSLLWDKENPLHDRVKLLELAGPEHPQAFVEVLAMPSCLDAGVAPLLAARTKSSFLISSMDAVHLRRAELADFFALRLGSGLPMKIDRNLFLSRLDRHGLQALELTGQRIAQDLPFYSVHFS